MTTTYQLSIPSFDFLSIVQAEKLSVVASRQAIPETCGAYRLFDRTGHQIYVGKAESNLRDIICGHFGENEANPIIKQHAYAFIWNVTPSRDAAVLLEGKLYLDYFQTFKKAPMANRISPPGVSLLLDLASARRRMASLPIPRWSPVTASSSLAEARRRLAPSSFPPRYTATASSLSSLLSQARRTAAYKPLLPNY